ncbi:HAAS signaling domain-containing protein [Arthrobacter sulfonylureivorans]|uniref:HAAS signaling domain-containing protein n=1 Tax=Arthrobacter sulfonylureivorans TaxID=2486855 RepID=UPI0039E63230
MSSLTEKYVAQVVRRLPENNRADIAREITATLSDMADARLAADEYPSPAAAEAAERAALEELGDPSRLALRYSESPRYLIGPELFPVFTRLTAWLLPIVAVSALAVNALVYVLATPEPAVGGMIGTMVGNSILAVLLAVAVVTVLLALAERLLSEKDKAQLAAPATRSGWSVDDLLREPPVREIARPEPIASLVILAVMALVPFLPTSFFYVGHLNGGGGFLNPALWDGWIPAYLGFLAAFALIEIWRLASGRWSTAMLATMMVADVAFAAFLTAAFLSQDVLDPALFAGSGGEPGWYQGAAVVLIWVVTVWDQLATVKAYREAQSLRPVGPR